MIQMRTWLTVADNSGARKLYLHHAGGAATRDCRRASATFITRPPVKEATPESQVKRELL